MPRPDSVDHFLTRYRNLSLLILVVFSQLLLLAYQVQTRSNVRLIRVWSVAAITPVARGLETVRSGVTGFLDSYIFLRGVEAEFEQARHEADRLLLENHELRQIVSASERAEALKLFREQTASRTVPARVIAVGAGGPGRSVFIDRGVRDGIRRGMGVITPKGIVGKVLAAYSTASQVLLLPDPSFAAGVVTAGARVQGTLKGAGTEQPLIDYLPNQVPIAIGEQIFTSGFDGVFPRGIPVGKVVSVRETNSFQQVFIEPHILAASVEEVLVVVQGVHAEIPSGPAAPGYHIMPSPDEVHPAESALSLSRRPFTEADRIRQNLQNHSSDPSATAPVRPADPVTEAAPAPRSR